MDWGLIVTNAIKSVISFIGGLSLEASKGWIKHRRELYRRWKKLIEYLIKEINEVEEKVKSFDKSPYINSEFSEILSYQSRQKFEDLLEAIQDYNAIYNATVETILKVTKKKFEDLNSMPTEAKTKILRIIGYSDYQDFIDRFSKWFVDCFYKDILRQILNGKTLNINWFIRETADESWSLETKDKIRKLIDQSSIDISFETILNRLEHGIKRERIIYVLKKQHEKVLQECEQLKEMIHRDLKKQRILSPIKKIADVQTIKKLEELLETSQSLYL